jgi:glutamate racemase
MLVLEKTQRPVLFLDSGIGGLPYLRHFHAAHPSLPLVYAADRAHFPYGERSREELGGILISLAGRLKAEFDPLLAVLACNTASVSALDLLRGRFPDMPWVGTVPAVKPAVRESRSRRIGVLGTRRTVEDPYISELAARYGPDCEIVRAAAPELVDFIEEGGDRAGAAAQGAEVIPYIEKFRGSGVDGIVLGCTHFLHLLDSFTAAALPDIRIYDSIAGVSRRAAELLFQTEKASGEARAESKKQKAENLIILTGEAPPEKRWFERADAFGLRHRLPDAAGGNNANAFQAGAR